jgi:hypothetical protein
MDSSTTNLCNHRSFQRFFRPNLYFLLYQAFAKEGAGQLSQSTLQPPLFFKGFSVEA